MKRLGGIGFALGRAGVAGFILLSSLYALLAYLPFTYQQVHKGGLLPWLNAFGRQHARLYWVVLAIALATLLPEFRRVRTRWLAIGFAAVHGAAGFLLLRAPVMAAMRNDAGSYTVALLALVPLAWLAAIDLAGHCPRIEWARYRGEDDRRIFRAAWRSAIFLALVYCGIFHARTSVAWGIGERLAVLFATLLCHLLVFGVLFAALNLVRSAASLTPWPSAVEFALANALTAGIGFAILRMLVFRPLSFEGWMAGAYGAALSVGVVGCLAGLAVRRWHPERGPTDGLSLALTPVAIPVSNRFLQPVTLAGIAVLAWVLAVNTAIMDWNFMFQKLCACTMWVLSFACLHGMTPRLEGVPDKRITILFWAAMVMSGYRITAAAMATHPQTAAALEKYAGYDASFRMIRDALSAPPRDGGFYQFLAKSTNIPRSIPTSPVEIDPAGKLAATPGAKPNIFVIVIDSLRRDYVSPYNSNVSFTPSIDAFARESVVFRNAFTRYGGTGLAEPSIWVGGMTLHKQYVMPFHPMNALQKLIDAEQYQSYISMDPILRTVVKPTPTLVELDARLSDMDYRLCSSLGDLQGKLEQRGSATGPAFAYTQSQDIHISVINRERNSVVDGGSYGGFYAPYASRVHRLDGCFGSFVQFLKSRGLYDNTLLVLTADHGDSLGEDGLWGHAYTLVPEVVRVPLIVHLPRQYQGLYSDPRAVAFQSDITPSLYYLLGHKPTLKQPFYGRPLFTEAPAEQRGSQQDAYLLAASYAAVYGILGDSGTSLTVFDAVNFKDSFYELSASRSHTGMLSSRQRSSCEDEVRKQVGAINALYKFQPR